VAELNGQGLRTLFLKELHRFAKVWSQTVFSPLVTTSLYFLVFGVALGSRLRDIDGVPYIQYVVPGLIMLSMISNAFLNTSSSLFQSKINGTIVDLLVAPLGTVEILTAYVGAAVTRAVLVGSLVYAVAWGFTRMPVHHPGWAAYFTLSVSSSFALMGLLVALWAEKYDHLSFVPNFLLTPLTFLGGVFYSVHMLPEPWRSVSHANPILYMVNGLRYAVLGHSDVDVRKCALAVAAFTLVTAVVTVFALVRGYKLRT